MNKLSYCFIDFPTYIWSKIFSKCFPKPFDYFWNATICAMKSNCVRTVETGWLTRSMVSSFRHSCLYWKRNKHNRPVCFKKSRKSQVQKTAISTPRYSPPTFFSNFTPYFLWRFSKRRNIPYEYTKKEGEIYPEKRHTKNLFPKSQLLSETNIPLKARTQTQLHQLSCSTTSVSARFLCDRTTSCMEPVPVLRKARVRQRKTKKNRCTVPAGYQESRRRRILGWRNLSGSSDQSYDAPQHLRAHIPCTPEQLPVRQPLPVLCQKRQEEKRKMRRERGKSHNYT